MNEEVAIRDVRGRAWTQQEIARVHEGGDPPTDISPRAVWIGDENACMICQMNELPPERVHDEVSA